MSGEPSSANSIWLSCATRGYPLERGQPQAAIRGGHHIVNAGVFQRFCPLWADYLSVYQRKYTVIARTYQHFAVFMSMYFEHIGLGQPALLMPTDHPVVFYLSQSTGIGPIPIVVRTVYFVAWIFASFGVQTEIGEMALWSIWAMPFGTGVPEVTIVIQINAVDLYRTTNLARNTEPGQLTVFDTGEALVDRQEPQTAIGRRQYGSCVATGRVCHFLTEHR